MTVRKYLTLALLLLLPALALAQQSLYEAYAQSAELKLDASRKCQVRSNKAIVYFYRVNEANALRKGQTKLSINDSKEAMQMPKGSYAGFYFDQGDYQLTLGHRDTDYLLTAKGGQTYFFRVSNMAAGFSQLRTLSVIDPAQAANQMRDLKALNSDNIKDKHLVRCD